MLSPSGRRSAALLFALSMAALSTRSPAHEAPAGAANQAPQFTTEAPPIAVLDRDYRYTPGSTDADGDAVSLSLVEAPAGMVLTGEPATLQWRPTSADLGLQSVRLRAQDPHGAFSEQVFDLRTLQAFCPIYPIAIPQSQLQGRQPGQLIEQMPRASGAGGFSWLSWSGAADAPTLAVSLRAPGDSYTYRNPDAADDAVPSIGDWVPSAPGSMNAQAIRERLDALAQTDIVVPVWDSQRGQGNRLDYRIQRFISIRLRDYRLTGNGWISFEYRGEARCYNRAPVAQSLQLQTREDTELAIALQASDPDGDPLQLRLLDGPEHGELSGEGAELRYTPAADYHGHDRLRFLASDDELESAPVTIDIDILPVNDAPVAQAQTLQTDEDTALPIRWEGVDADGDALNYYLVDPPTHGQLEGAGQDWTYRPDPDFAGNDSLSFKVSDGALDSPPARVTLTIGPVNDAPVFQSQPPLAARDCERYRYPVAATDADPGDVLEYALAVAPAGMVIDARTGLVEWSPQPDQAGSHPVELMVSDAAGASATQAFDLTVAVCNAAPEIVSEPVTTIPEGETYRYRVEAVDPDGDAVRYSVERAPMVSSIDANSGELQSTLQSIPVQGTRATNTQCALGAGAARVIDPTLRWHWDSPTQLPDYRQVMMAPIVVQTSDDNGDGRIDVEDVPDVALVSYAAQNAGQDGVIRILDGATGAERVTVADPQARVSNYSQLAAADIDGDGLIEIVGVRQAGGLVAIEHDGQVKWTTSTPDYGWNYGGASIADVDGDGTPEIVFGNAVINADGSLRWQGDGPYRGGLTWRSIYTSLAFAVDISASPGLELIAGPSAYSADGELLWRYDGIGDGFAAVADLDLDGAPEIVVVGSGKVVALRADGQPVWGPVELADGWLGGAPTIANFVGDAHPEIGLADKHSFRVLDALGEQLWSFPIRDLSSASTGSTSFDFDGDGRMEIVQLDETTLRIVDGADGATLWSTANASGTAIEYPVVADVDGDGGADVLVPSNLAFGGEQTGLRMFSSASGAWMPTRSIWNQHAYHVDNIQEDGSVPRVPAKSWLTHNTFRLNTFPGRPLRSLPDLALFDLRLDEREGTAVEVVALNRGLASTSAATRVRIFSGDPDTDGTELGLLEVPVMAAGEERRLRLGNLNAESIDADLYARIDEAGLIQECAEDNNYASAAQFVISASDPAGLGDTQRFTVTVENVNDAPELVTTELAPATAGSDYRFRIVARDRDVGDGLRFELLDAPSGLHIDAINGELRWQPTNTQIGAHSVTVRVEDLQGASDQEQFDLSVARAGNHPPQFTSTPVAEVCLGSQYRYQPVVVDVDEDALRYQLTAAPPGMAIDVQSGLIEWSPQADQAGSHPVELMVSDAAGANATQAFELTVTACNATPEIVSEPVTTIPEGATYRYRVEAVDPDGDTLRHELLRASAGLALDAASGQFSGVADPQTVQPVRAFNWQCLVVPDGTSSSGDAFISPMFQQVRAALSRASNYVAPQTLGWDGRAGCLGCHVQNQALLGLQVAERKADVDTEAAEYLLAKVLASQQADGSIRLSHQEYSLAQTALAMWALSYVPDRSRTRSVRTEGLRFFLGRVRYTGTGENIAYWEVDHRSGWWFSDEAMTSLIGLVASRYVSEVFEATDATDATAEQLQIAHQWRVLIPKMARMLFGQTVQRDDQLLTALNYIGTAEMLPHLTDGAQRAEANERITGMDAWLRSRANADGGFLRIGRIGYGSLLTSSDPLTSAWVGFALGYRHPPVSDPVVRANIQFLLGSQQADGTWRTNTDLFQTPLATTGLVMAYLPVALEHLGNPDLALGHIELSADEHSLSIEVMNRGLADVSVGSRLRVFAGPVPSQGRMIAEVDVPEVRSEGSRWVDVPIDGEVPDVVSARIAANEDIQECGTANNVTVSSLVEVRTEDPGRLFDTQRYFLNVEDRNSAPVIVSNPPTTLAADGSFVYQVEVQDPDIGDAHLFELVAPATGLSIDSISGRIIFSGSEPAAQGMSVLVRVTDLRGGSDEQRFTVSAVANQAPTITSTPDLEATVGQLYRYPVLATDGDGDPLSFRLVIAPLTMQIDGSSGLITWMPLDAQQGPQSITIEVTDGRGGRDTQPFTLQVSAAPPNTAPQITSTPPPSAKVGHEYRYAVLASDAEGDALTFSLFDSPAGMSIDAASGELRWTPMAAGRVGARVRVADAGAWAEQAWSIDVTDASVALSATLTVTPDPVPPGATFTITHAIMGAAGPVTLDATLDGQPLALDADGSTELSAASESAAHLLRLTVSDGFDSVTVERSYWVGQPTDLTPPAVALIDPAAHADYDTTTITAPTAVTGEVSGNDVSRWVLAVQMRGEPDWRELAAGSGEFSARRIADFDPTLLENGLYTLALQAWDTSGNVGYDSRVLLVDGAMKLGHFSISFEEVSIPVAGIPVTVTRTYDTRRARSSLDFGYGWTVDANAVRLQESRRPGFAWTIQEPRNLSDRRCWVPNGDPIVTVRLPDGELAKFKARAATLDGSACQHALDPNNQIQLVFDPIDGTDGQLEQLDYGALVVATVAGQSGSHLTEYGDQVGEPVDPRHYRLSTADGLVYTIDQFDGLQQVLDTATETHLSFSRDGVLHSSGIGIRFVRDPQGRIVSMELPDGSALGYQYAANGDLLAVSDPLGHPTAYTYLDPARHPHYLRDIIDARGVRVSRNEYDDGGRLVATIDADGQRIEFDHLLDVRTERVRDRRGNATTYVYDERGRVLTETNALGETVTRSYDGDDNLLSQTDALGRTTHWTYDTRGNRLTETNPAGETTTSTYSAANQLLEQLDALNRSVISNTYDARSGRLLVATRDALGQSTQFAYLGGTGIFGTGQLAAITDPSGAVTRFDYDFHGFRNQEIDALGQSTYYVPDDMGRVREEQRSRTRADGSIETLITRYTLDAKGQVTAITHPDGSVTTTEYDGNGKPVRECDALRRCTETEYNARGEVVRITYADGSSEHKAYDPNGNLIAQTDRNGQVTRHVYDAANRMLETIHPDDTPGDDADNPRSRSVYDAAGQLVASIDEAGQTTRYEYDAAGRRILTVLPAVDGVTAELRDEYDAAGRRIASIDASGLRTEYVYDAGGRLVETRVDGSVAKVEYDASGRKTAEIDAEGRITRYAYDALGRLVAVVLPDPASGANPALVEGASPHAGTLTTRYRYDELGNKIEQIDAEGRSTRWEYDSMGRETARILPEGEREEKRYNAAGELVEHTDFKGETTRYAYDAAGRLGTLDYPHDADLQFAYSDAGERIRVVDGRGESTTGHDARGRVVQAQDADGGRIEYAYDAVGNLIARISPSQSLLYAYDARHRLIEVTRSVDGEAPSITRYEYDASGNRSAMSGGDGTRTEYGYDLRHRLRSLVKKTAAGALLLALNYSVDASGMRSAVEESDPAGLIRSVAYRYDGVKRLVEEAIDHRDEGHDRRSLWTYDRVGNRLTQTVDTRAGSETTRYEYDRNDRLGTEVRAGVATVYAYDANGNTTAKAEPGALTEYVYDDANRLIEARTQAATTRYTYDADGLRVRQTVTPTGGEPTTTYYLQDSAYPYAQVIEQHTRQGNGPKRLSATFTFADELVSQTRYDEAGTPDTTFVQADGFGSTRWVTDAIGSITDSIDYDAFGVEIGRSGATDVEHLYRGERWDANVAAYDLRARLYTPGNGRFLTQDSFVGFSQDPQSLHKYIYANASPVNGIDPAGLTTMPEQLANQNIIGQSLTSAVSFLTSRAGVAATAKFGAELAFEYATGIPVLTSPRGMLNAVKSLRSAAGNIAETLTQGAVARMRAGRTFEALVGEMWKGGLRKNGACFKNGVRDTSPGCFIPDFFSTAAGRLIEIKTSMGAVKKRQFQEFLRISLRSGQPMSMLLLHRPSPADVARLQRWAAEVAGESEDILVNIIHVLD